MDIEDLYRHYNHKLQPERVALHISWLGLTYLEKYRQKPGKKCCTDNVENIINYRFIIKLLLSGDSIPLDHLTSCPIFNFQAESQVKYPPLA